MKKISIIDQEWVDKLTINLSEKLNRKYIFLMHRDWIKILV